MKEFYMAAFWIMTILHFVTVFDTSANNYKGEYKSEIIAHTKTARECAKCYQDQIEITTKYYHLCDSLNINP